VQERIEEHKLPLAPPLNAFAIDDGNLNFAWCVHKEGAPSQAVFVKQAPPYIKCLGEAFALGSERLLLESEVLSIYNRLAPSFAPTLYTADKARSAMILEFLRDYELMRSALVRGEVDPVHVISAASFMAQTHALTHVSVLPPDEAQGMRTSLANEQMSGITAEYVFSKPLDAADGTNRCSDGVSAAAAALRADAALVAGFGELRALFLESRECLIHGDLHTGSIMVPASEASESGGGGGGGAKVIDQEFAMFGCAAFDVGTFISHLVFPWVRHWSAAEPSPAVASLQEMVPACWATYAAGLRSHAPGASFASDHALQQTLQQTAGFAGCELIRRIIGAAHVSDLESISDPAQRAAAEVAALRIGTALVKQHAALTSIEGLVACIDEVLK